jgi:hypothetical protein
MIDSVKLRAAVSRSLLVVLLHASTSPAEEYSPVYLDDDDPSLIDVEGSLDYRYSEARRFSFDGDLRGGYFDSRIDLRDGGKAETDEFTLRVRYGANFGFNEHLRVRARLAAVCGTSACDPNIDISRIPANGSNINGGDIVVDELYLDLFKQDQIDVVIGRMQTRAVTRGGVFISSLTRLTSPNVAVNWTDGMAVKYVTESGWNSKVIVQYNDPDGSSTLARSPLDFSDDDSRVSYFYSLENRQLWGLITQRSFDLSYMPSALVISDGQDGPVVDYWNLVGRAASEWPVRSGPGSVIVSGELGYAPNTQTNASADLEGGGDVGGIAWHLEASWMNFQPGHSIGVNYGQSDAGWLISPVYRPNEVTAVLRYHWRPRQGVQLEVQGRWREDLEQLESAANKRQTFDWRLRLSWSLRTRTAGR